MIRSYLGWLLAACALTACGGGDETGGPTGQCISQCGVSGEASNNGSGNSTTALASNQTTLTVGPGPSGVSDANIPYVTVTVCNPATGTCATIDDVLVDTGSYGFRILASVLASAGLHLPALADPNNSKNTIAECGPFADGYTWGAVSAATIEIGGETASNIPINVLDDDGSYGPGVPAGCTALTVNQPVSNIQDLHANGILGVGLFPYDCGAACANCAALPGGCSSANTLYYTCNSTSGGCDPVQMALSAQVRNPVISFATDNNGVIVQLPGVASSGAASAVGSITFGIGTQSNNGFGSAGVLTVDGAGDFTTLFDNQTLGNSFIDSGSNAYYFPDKSIPTCSANAEFYCPSSTLSLSATNLGQNGASSIVGIQIADLNSLSTSNFALADIGGQAPSDTGSDVFNNYFDFGLPFFYGRSVFVLFDGATSGSVSGPAYAY
jgi:Protein of unknown function (DUF3443)